MIRFPNKNRRTCFHFAGIAWMVQVTYLRCPDIRACIFLVFSQISFLLISYLLFPLRLHPLIISTNHASQIVFFITPNLLGSHFVCSFSILVLFSSFMISNAEIIINFIRFCSRRLTFKLLKIESFFEKFSFSLGTEKSSRSFPRRRRG